MTMTSGMTDYGTPSCQLVEVKLETPKLKWTPSLGSNPEGIIRALWNYHKTRILSIN